MSDLPDAPDLPVAADVPAAPNTPAVPAALTFEQGFAAVETAAGAAEAAARALATTARRLRKTAQEGTLVRLRREIEQLEAALAVARERVGGAVTSWPFAEPDEESAYVREQYAGELQGAAAAIGLNVAARDEALVCSPSIIQVLPGDRALKIDGKKRNAIRPSRLAADLQAMQRQIRTKSEAQQQRFLEALLRAYKVIIGDSDPALFQSARVVPLAKVYAVFTSLPGISAQYTRTDFARDVYLLDSSSVATTQAGMRVKFTGSVRQGRAGFSFVDRNGNVIRYYGVQFTAVEGQR